MNFRPSTPNHAHAPATLNPAAQGRPRHLLTGLLFSLPIRLASCSDSRFIRVNLRLTLFLLLTTFSTVATAQSPARSWRWQNPLPQGNAINAIRFAPDKKHGWAIGSDGAILRTKNGGFEWEPQTSPVLTTLNGLYVKNKDRAVVVGARGLILLTTNGGDKWLAKPSGSKDHLYGVTFAPEESSHGWAVGSYGRILATTDGGLTWQAQTSPVRSHLFCVSFADKDRGVAVGDRGALIVTQDGGANWEKKSGFSELPLTSVTFLSKDKA